MTGTILLDLAYSTLDIPKLYIYNLLYSQGRSSFSSLLEPTLCKIPLSLDAYSPSSTTIYKPLTVTSYCHTIHY